MDRTAPADVRSFGRAKKWCRAPFLGSGRKSVSDTLFGRAESTMKLSLSTFTVALAACAAFAAAGLHAAQPVAGAAAPDFVLKSVAGSNIRLSEHRSDVVMLAFTASWCSECRVLEARLAELYRRYREAGLVLLAVSLDKDRRGAESVASRVAADFPVLIDARGEAGRLYDVSKLPTLVLIDRTGAVRDVFEGGAREDLRTDERVRTLLREL